MLKSAVTGWNKDMILRSRLNIVKCNMRTMWANPLLFLREIVQGIVAASRTHTMMIPSYEVSAASGALVESYSETLIKRWWNFGTPDFH